MTISKERFTAICYEVADAINEDGYGYIFKQDAEAFGLALIKRVEAEVVEDLAKDIKDIVK